MSRNKLIAITIAVLMAMGSGCGAFAEELPEAAASPEAVTEESTEAAAEPTAEATEPAAEESTSSAADAAEPTAEETAEPVAEPAPTREISETKEEAAAPAEAAVKSSAADSVEAKAANVQTTKAQAAAKRVTLASLKRPAISSLWNSALKKVSLKWKVDKYADGYEIYYKQANKKRKIIKVKPDGLYVLKNLQKGKKYKIKIRSYRKQDGKTLRSKWSKVKSIRTQRTDWNQIQKKYSQKKNVKELIFVKYKGNSKARLYLYKKNSKNQWTLVLSCKAYTGRNGINKVKEGDKKTPTGDFAITHAFGIQKDPGSRMNYLKVNKNHYWCADKYYNKLVDVSKQKHSCHGEHLITYTKQYAYAMNIGYNTAGKNGKGSAIFLHCFGKCQYTLGCVSVSQSNMIRILKTCEPGTRICIYRE